MRLFSSTAVRAATVRRVVKPRISRGAPVGSRVSPELSTAASSSSSPLPASKRVENVAESHLAAPRTAESVMSVPEIPQKSSDSPTLDENMVDSLNELELAQAGETLGDDWASSFSGLGSAPFPQRVIDILMAPVEPADVEVTPDGLIYLPEIKYRRILNRAFGPGGWGIAPRTKTMVTKRKVTREYGLVCLGRLVSVSRGEMDFFSAEGVTTAMEGCKSNALMRCCKDLGIASELWDPAFIRKFKNENCDSKYFEKRKRFVWKRKDRQWEYPYV